MIAPRSQILPAILILAAPLSGCLSSPTQPPSPAGVALKSPASETLPPKSSSLPPDTAGDADLWQRIRHGMQLKIPEDSRVTAELQRITRHPRYLTQVSERARPFLYLIVEEIESRRLPAELGLLPIIESTFDPAALSPMKAAGLWQFMPATAEGIGLKQNWWYDGRRDVLASTDAALDYLQQLNKQFNGDWELTLAAYNAGPGTILNAIKKNRETGKATDYWSLDLSSETRRYVPKLLAVSRLIKKPQHYAVSLAKIKNRPALELVRIGSQIDLALAAKLGDIAVKDIRFLNPGFKRWATDPEGPHHLLLPRDNAETFQQQVAQLEPKKRVSWRVYQVRQGDTLTRIARRHGTTSIVLQRANGLRSARIRPGRRLLIPKIGLG